MRLIDAEKYPCKGCPIEYCYENCKKFYAWLDGCDYDVEAKVAELEKYAKSKICDKHKHGCPYKDNEDIYCENCGALGAISIVRGKE